MQKAIVLLSGGLDSTTTLAIAQQQGFELHTLSFDYGQRHQREVDAAAAIARYYGVTRQKTITIDLRTFGGSALTADIPMPHARSLETMAADIPITYVPARNTIFLSYALAYAEVTGANDIFLGINAIDYSGYPDCRGEYLEAYERMANLATKASTQEGRRFDLRAPLLRMGKADIIRKGAELAVPYEYTWSCYEGGNEGLDAKHCGRCGTCVERYEAFKLAHVADPTEYEHDPEQYLHIAGAAGTIG